MSVTERLQMGLVTSYLLPQVAYSIATPRGIPDHIDDEDPVNSATAGCKGKPQLRVPSLSSSHGKPRCCAERWNHRHAVESLARLRDLHEIAVRWHDGWPHKGGPDLPGLARAVSRPPAKIRQAPRQLPRVGLGGPPHLDLEGITDFFVFCRLVSGPGLSQADDFQGRMRDMA